MNHKSENKRLRSALESIRDSEDGARDMYEIAVNALEFKSEAEVVKISHTYLPDKITGEVIMTKPISCCEFWKIFANNKRAIKEGMVVNGRKISDVEYCRSEDNQCKFLFEASYGKGYNNE